MTPEQQYGSLKEAAAKIGLEVREKNLHIPGIRVKSGLCKVKGRRVFILDKKKMLREKVSLLAGCLSGLDYKSHNLSDDTLSLIKKHAGVSDDEIE